MAINFTGGSLATYNDTTAADTFAAASGQIDNNPGPVAGVGNLQDSTPNGTNYVYALTGTGVTSGTGTTSIATQYGTLLLNSNGSYTFTPNQTAINALAAGTAPTISVEVAVRDTVDGDTGSALFSLTFNGAADAPTFVRTPATDPAGVLGTYADTGANDVFAVASGQIDTNPSATATTGVGQLSGDNGSTYTYLLGNAAGGSAGVSTITSGTTTVGYVIDGTYGRLTLTTDGRYQYAPNNAAINALGAGATATDTFTIRAVDSNGTQSVFDRFVVNVTGAQETAVSVTGGQLAAYADTTTSGETFAAFQGRLDNDPGAGNTGTAGSGSLDGGTGTITYALTGANVVVIGDAAGNPVGTSVTNEFGQLILSSDGRYEFIPNSAAIDTLRANQAPTLSYTIQTSASGTPATATTAAVPASSATATYTIALTGATDPQTFTGGTLATFTDTAARDNFALATGTLDTNPSTAVTAGGVGAFQGDQGTRTYSLINPAATNIVVGGTVVGQQLVTAYGTLTLASDGRYQFEPNQNAINGLVSNDQLSIGIRVSNDTGLTTSTTTNGVTTTSPAPVVNDASFTINLVGANDTALTVQGGSLATYTDTNAADRFLGLQGNFDTNIGATNNASSNTFDPTAGGTTPAQGGFAPTTGPTLGNIQGGTGTLSFALTGAGTTTITSGTGTSATTVGYQQTGTYGTFFVATDGRYQFVPNNTAIDALRTGQTAVVNYTVQVTQGTGDAAVSQSANYSITLIGGDDNPAVTLTPTSQVLTETDAALTATGTVAASGAAGDTFTFSRGPATSENFFFNATTTSTQNNPIALTTDQQTAFRNAFSLNTTTGAYTFNLASPDYLNAGQTVTAFYRVNVADQFGQTTSQFVTVTVNGSQELVAGATDGSDVLTGGAFGDLINGGVGDDIIRGLAGRDELNGGSGDDQLYGDAGNDILRGGAGDDLLSGGSSTAGFGASNTAINSTAGFNVIDGGDGQDTGLLLGNRANYTVTEANGTLFFRNANGTEAHQFVNVEFFQFADGSIQSAAAVVANNPTPSGVNIIG